MAKVMAVVLLVALLCASLAVAADGDPESQSSPPGESKLDASPIPETAEEIPDERTANSRTYEMPSGANATEIFQTPINYREPDGDWKPIETDLQKVKKGSGIANGHNSFDLRLPDAMGPDAVRIAEDDRWVSYRLLGPIADLVELEGDRATYETASGAVAFELTSMPTGIKEDIVLSNASSPSSFAFELKASEDLDPEIAKNGSLHFKDQEGKTFAVLPTPIIADSSGASSTSTSAVSHALTDGQDGTWRLTVTADPQWLADPERAWPVRIDPTVTIASAPYEGAIFSVPAPAGYGVSGANYQNLPAAFLPGYSSMKVRFLVRFDLGSVPSTGSIYDATLSLYSPEAAENTPGVEVKQLTSPANVGADWQRAYNFSGLVGYWKSLGGDFNSAIGATVNTSERPSGSGPGWWDFRSDALTDLVGDWKAGVTPNFGVIAKQTDETQGSLCSPAPPNCERRNVGWYTSTGPVGFRPKLVVSYWPAAPAQAKVISPPDGTTTAKRLKLQAGWNSGVTQVLGWQYRVNKSGIFKEVPNELLRNGEGKSVSWPEIIPSGLKSSKPIYLDAGQLSPTLRKKGGSVQLRARFEGGAAGSVPRSKRRSTRRSAAPKTRPQRSVPAPSISSPATSR